MQNEKYVVFFILVYGRIHHFLFIKLLGAVRLGKLGIRAFRLVISLESYVVILIGYFAFKPIFNGKK